MKLIRSLALIGLLLAAPAAAQTVIPGGGGAPSGAAGGDLSGTYPNPTVGSIGGIANVAPTTWTPTDASGAALSFTTVSANYTKIGNMVFAYGRFTYPATADVSPAAIGGFPVAFPSPQYARQCNLTSSSETTLAGVLPPAGGGTTVILVNSAAVGIANSAMSGDTIFFMCIYPAS